MWVNPETTRAEQLRKVETYIHGYNGALHTHGIDEPGLDFARRLGKHLERTRGWSTSCGPVDAIVTHPDSDEHAWEHFWELVAEYRDAGPGPDERDAASPRGWYRPCVEKVLAAEASWDSLRTLEKLVRSSGRSSSSTSRVRPRFARSATVGDGSSRGVLTTDMQLAVLG